MQHILTVALALVLAALFYICALDWIGGCGESFVYADGSRHVGECLGRDLVSHLGGFHHE